MKVSIITVALNAAATIRTTIDSVLSQTHNDIEYIVIDGQSTDGTPAIIESFDKRIAKVYSGPDSGPFEAMNTGIAKATGEVVGILNADDFYVDNQVIAKVVRAFTEHGVDAVFADLVYVRPDNLDKVVRYYRGKDFSLEKFAQGAMPPHPTFFTRRRNYEKYGIFRDAYKIAADFELLARFFYKHGISYYYLPEILVKMRTGGLSGRRGVLSHYQLNKAIVGACRENGISTNFFKIHSRYLAKILQLIDRP